MNYIALLLIIQGLFWPNGDFSLDNGRFVVMETNLPVVSIWI
jgi:hypothetical protein